MAHRDGGSNERAGIFFARRHGRVDAELDRLGSLALAEPARKPSKLLGKRTLGDLTKKYASE